MMNPIRSHTINAHGLRDYDLRVLAQVRSQQPAYVPTIVQEMNGQSNTEAVERLPLLRVMRVIRALTKLEELGFLEPEAEPLDHMIKRLSKEEKPNFRKRQQRVFYSLTEEGEHAVQKFLH